MFDELQKYIDLLPFLFTGLAFTILFTPIWIKLTLKFGIYDKPKSQLPANMRGIDTVLHEKILPRAAFVPILLPIFIISPFVIHMNLQVFGIGLALVILFILGILDDKYRLPAGPQFIIQILAIFIVILTGTTIQEANNPFTGSFINFERGHVNIFILGTQLSFTLLSIIVTFLWMFVITNTINWADGVDGVLNGIVCIPVLILLLVSIRNGSYATAVVCALFLGANLGMLRYSFAPAQIINGYGGVIYGFLISIFAISGQVKLSIAIFLLLIPLIDVCWVIIYRIRKYKPRSLKQLAKAASTPGPVHLSHRLMDLGFSPKKVAIAEYIIYAFVGLFAILLSGLELTFILLSSVFTVLLIFILLDKMIKKKLITNNK